MAELFDLEFQKSTENALENYLAGDLSEARRILTAASERALELGKSDYYSFFEAELAFADNNFELAIKKYDSAILHSPQNPLFLSNKGVAVGMQGLAEDALQLLDSALALDSSNLHALVSSLSFLIELGRVEQARKRAKILYEDNAVPIVYRFYAVEALIDLDKDEIAALIISEFLKLHPHSPFASGLSKTLSSKRSVRQSREYKRRPSVRALLTCDHCSNQEGKIDCTGIFDTIRLFSFPAIAPDFAVYCSVLSRRIRNRAVLSLRDADGNRLFHLVGRATAGDLLVPTSAIFQIKGVVLNKPGSYTLDLTLNGDVIAYTQISVVQLQPRADYSKEVVEGLLQNPKAIKCVRFKFPCPKCKTAQALQMNLDPSASASQGYVLAPNENSVRCPHCGTEIPIAEPKLRARELLGIVPEGDAGEGATAQTEVELR